MRIGYDNASTTRVISACSHYCSLSDTQAHDPLFLMFPANPHDSLSQRSQCECHVVAFKRESSSLVRITVHVSLTDGTNVQNLVFGWGWIAKQLTCDHICNDWPYESWNWKANTSKRKERYNVCSDHDPDNNDLRPHEHPALWSSGYWIRIHTIWFQGKADPASLSVGCQ